MKYSNVLKAKVKLVINDKYIINHLFSIIYQKHETGNKKKTHDIFTLVHRWLSFQWCVFANFNRINQVF